LELYIIITIRIDININVGIDERAFRGGRYKQYDGAMKIERPAESGREECPQLGRDLVDYGPARHA